jgi:hypothetical protein
LLLLLHSSIRHLLVLGMLARRMWPKIHTSMYVYTYIHTLFLV